MFAPNSKHRALVTPAKRGKGSNRSETEQERTPGDRRALMRRAQRLKRIFNIDIETCSACGGEVRVIACIEDPVVIQKILDHLKNKAEPSETTQLPKSRAPPMALFTWQKTDRSIQKGCAVSRGKIPACWESRRWCKCKKTGGC